MSYIDSNLKRIFQQIRSAIDVPEENRAYAKARKFVSGLSDDDKAHLAEKDFSEYASGDAFIQNILDSIVQFENKDETNKKAADKNKKTIEKDVSIFSKSMDDIEKMDLSQDAINKALEDENGNRRDFNFEDSDDSFLAIMDAIYSDALMHGIIDIDSDGKISNDEAQEFLKALNSNGDEEFTIDDIKYFFDEINGIKSKEEKEWKELEKESIKNNQGPIDFSSYGGGGISHNPYSPSYGSYSAQSGSYTGSVSPKNDLQDQIDDYKKQISQVQSGEHTEVKEKIEARDDAKTNLDEAVDADENLTQEQKDAIKENAQELSEKDEQISDIDSQLALKQQDLSAGEAKLSDLKSSLDSISNASFESTGDSAQDSQIKARIEERKQELESQIQAQEEQIAQIKNEISELENQKQELENQRTQITENGLNIEKYYEVSGEKADNATQIAIEKYNQASQAINETKTKLIDELTDKLNTAQEKLQKIETEENESKNNQAQMTYDASFEEMLGFVLGVEGGISNHANDKGGLTNLGITQSTYTNWLKSQGKSAKSVENITVDEAKEIYYKNYFKASGAENYLKAGNSAYAFALFDASVNHGVGGAKNLDKKANGDLDKFLTVRANKYRQIIEKDSSQAVFKKGWQNRLNKLSASLGLKKTYTI